MRFGEKLRELRKQRGLRQKDIAKELNIAQNTYSDYENDKVQPSFESLVKISNILQVPIDLLFFDFIYVFSFSFYDFCNTNYYY